MARVGRGGPLPFVCISRRQLALGLAGVWAGVRHATAAEAPVIAAAASLRPPLGDIVAAFEATTGQRVRVTFGATGTLVRQIEAGAPFDVFLAADQDSVVRLEAGGFTQGPGRVLVRGRIVLAARRGSAIAVHDGWGSVGRALDSGTVRRFAIANPDLAPYGRAARDVLQGAGLWPRLADRLVIAENIGQAAQFVASGGAEAGILALSNVQAPELRDQILWVPIGEELHAPIQHGMAVLRRAGEVARSFVEFLDTEPVRRIFERAGFAVP